MIVDVSKGGQNPVSLNVGGDGIEWMRWAPNGSRLLVRGAHHIEERNGLVVTTVTMNLVEADGWKVRAIAQVGDIDIRDWKLAAKRSSWVSLLTASGRQSLARIPAHGIGDPDWVWSPDGTMLAVVYSGRVFILKL